MMEHCRTRKEISGIAAILNEISSPGLTVTHTQKVKSTRVVRPGNISICQVKIHVTVADHAKRRRKGVLGSASYLIDHNQPKTLTNLNRNYSSTHAFRTGHVFSLSLFQVCCPGRPSVSVGAAAHFTLLFVHPSGVCGIRN